MRTICMYCRRLVSGDVAEPGPVSHGTCRHCVGRLDRELGFDLWLEDLRDRLAVMDRDRVVALLEGYGRIRSRAVAIHDELGLQDLEHVDVAHRLNACTLACIRELGRRLRAA